jgi:hypothetical protein
VSCQIWVRPSTLAVEDLDVTPQTALADDLVDTRRAIYRLEADLAIAHSLSPVRAVHPRG